MTPQTAPSANTGSTASASATTPTLEVYTVKAGDTLSKISKQFYGDAHEYMRIFYANRTQLDDPNMIRIGQKLTIPRDDN